MKTDCSSQFSLDFHSDKDIKGQFDGGKLTTDAGLFPLRQHEEDRDYYTRISEILNDTRQQSKGTHSYEEILRQRGLGIVAGYEDANDSRELSSDPAMIVCNNGSDLDEDEGSSQPTVSRFENNVSARSVVKLNRWLLEDWIKRNQKDPPDEVVLEVDATDDPTHGKQQRTLFHGYFEQYMYHPLMMFDGESGDCICARLGDGAASDKKRAIPHIKRIITRIREAFPEKKIQIKLRADAGFMDPDLYRMLEEEMVRWTINLARNDVLEGKVEEVFEQIKQEYEDLEEKRKITRYTEFLYRAGSWKCKRRVCAKVQYGPKGGNRRFVVTHFYEPSPEEVFSFYEERGQSENFIKEIKDGFSGDRLSCTRFVANAFRLLEHVLAYNLVNDFRNERLNETELARADIHTLRVKLFKVAARIKTTVRNVWIHLSESWPFRSSYLRAVEAVTAGAG